jgi:hypothetical protein
MVPLALMIVTALAVVPFVAGVSFKIRHSRAARLMKAQASSKQWRKKKRCYFGKRKQRKRTRMVWAERMASLTDTEFKQRYRLSKPLFTDLAGRLASRMQSKRRMVGIYAPIPVELQLSMTLRYLAGGSVYDIQDLHGVGNSTFYRCFYRTIDAIDDELSLHFPLHDKSFMRRLASGFARLCHNGFTGCVAALDGIAIKIRKPNLDETPDPMSYWNRKGFFALNVQAMVDSDKTFLWYSASTVGSTHDSTAFGLSDLHAKLEQNMLDSEFFIVGDDAYGLRSYLMTPCGSPMTKEKDSYNFYQSRCRINVECGMPYYFS